MGGGARAGAVLDAGARRDAGAVAGPGDSPPGLPASSFRDSRPITFRRNRASSRPRGVVLAVRRGLRPAAAAVAHGPVVAARAAASPAVSRSRAQERRRVAGPPGGRRGALVPGTPQSTRTPAAGRAGGPPVACGGA